MDPRYRFTIVISTLLVVWWLWVVISTYLFGPTGLNVIRYQVGIILVGLSALGGFLAVWLAHRLILWHRTGKTGFEAEPTDEFGTAFSMMNAAGKPEPHHIALSKFQPSLIAPPLAEASLHPLEAELIGFLQGFRHWPVRLDAPETSLYEDALARWHSVKALPGCTPWLRAAALGQNLCCIHAYEEQRTSAPWWQMWVKDTIRFKPRTEPRPGMSALLLSTMPAFRALGNTPEGPATQRALLAALRYHTNPQNLPVNTGPLAAQIIEGLQRAELTMGNMDASTLDELTPARREELLGLLPKLWLGILGQQTPASTLTPAATLYLTGGATMAGWLTLKALLQALGPQLEPALRTTLNLWDLDDSLTTQHPAWSHLLPLLQESNLIHPTYLGIDAHAGTFMLEASVEDGPPAPWGPAVRLNLQHHSMTTLVSSWNALPKGPAAELALQPEMLKARATLNLQQLENKIRELF